MGERLDDVWTFWKEQRGEQKSHFEMWRTVSSLSGFWSAFNNDGAIISELKQGHGVHIFRNGIRPLLEDRENQQGGHFVLVVGKAHYKADMWLRIATEVVLKKNDLPGWFIGEVNGIGGARCVRSDGEYIEIKVWLRGGAGVSSNERWRSQRKKELKQFFGIPTTWCDHKGQLHLMDHTVTASPEAVAELAAATAALEASDPSPATVAARSVTPTQVTAVTTIVTAGATSRHTRNNSSFSSCNFPQQQQPPHQQRCDSHSSIEAFAPAPQLSFDGSMGGGIQQHPRQQQYTPPPQQMCYGGSQSSSSPSPLYHVQQQAFAMPCDPAYCASPEQQPQHPPRHGTHASFHSSSSLTGYVSQTPTHMPQQVRGGGYYYPDGQQQQQQQQQQQPMQPVYGAPMDMGRRPSSVSSCSSGMPPYMGPAVQHHHPGQHHHHPTLSTDSLPTLPTPCQGTSPVSQPANLSFGSVGSFNVSPSAAPGVVRRQPSADFTMQNGFAPKQLSQATRQRIGHNRHASKGSRSSYPSLPTPSAILQPIQQQQAQAQAQAQAQPLPADRRVPSSSSLTSATGTHDAACITPVACPPAAAAGGASPAAVPQQACQPPQQQTQPQTQQAAPQEGEAGRPLDVYDDDDDSDTDSLVDRGDHTDSSPATPDVFALGCTAKVQSVPWDTPSTADDSVGQDDADDERLAQTQVKRTAKEGGGGGGGSGGQQQQQQQQKQGGGRHAGKTDSFSWADDY